MGFSPSGWTKLLNAAPSRRCRMAAMTAVCAAVLLTTMLIFSTFIETRDVFGGSVSSPRHHPAPFVAEEPHLIPRKIWQISLKGQNGDVAGSTRPSEIKDALTWLAMNPDYEL